MVNHLLIDVDSKIPNLPLMKISNYLRSRGDTAQLLESKRRCVLPAFFEEWRQVWISCVFTWNRPLALYYADFFERRGAKVKLGGSGVSLNIRLPLEIEQLPPDYELYGDDRAIGFVQRGCIRKCEFCIVPEKEGRLVDNPFTPLASWVPDGFSKILLLDNEFAASPYEEQVLREVKTNGWKLSITQGYDLRCMTEAKAGLLADEKPWDLKFRERRLYCAWDYFPIEPYVRKGIGLLLKAGFSGSEIMCYCLAGFNTSHLQDYYRFHVLWKIFGVLPFIMRYNLRSDDKFLNAFARWVNRGPASYRNHSFEDYCFKRAPKFAREAGRIIDHVEAGLPIPMGFSK